MFTPILRTSLFGSLWTPVDSMPPPVAFKALSQHMQEEVGESFQEGLSRYSKCTCYCPVHSLQNNCNRSICSAPPFSLTEWREKGSCKRKGEQLFSKPTLTSQEELQTTKLCISLTSSKINRPQTINVHLKMSLAQMKTERSSAILQRVY